MRKKGSKNKQKKGITPVGSYKATLKCLNKYYNAEGATALEAIQNLKPDIGKGVSILTVEKDGFKREKVLNNRLTMGLFSEVGRVQKEIAFKQIIALFDF